MSEKKTKERQLNAAELKRKENFEKLTEQLRAEGYEPNYITVSAKKANMLAFVTPLPFAIPLFIVYILMGYELQMDVRQLVVVFLLYFSLIAVHELIHGLSWAIFAPAGWSAISFGFIVSALTPYCTCTQPLKKSQQIVAALMPTIILGFVPGVIALFIGSTPALLLSIMMIFSGSGDFWIAYNLFRYRSSASDILFIDHPLEIGVAVFEK